MRVSVVLLSSLCGIACPLGGNAQAIHKCTAADGVAYQAAPCAAGASDVLIASRGAAGASDVLVESRGAAGESRSESPAATASAVLAKRAPEPGAKRLFQRTRIALGMSDDEVLNMPNWGRPHSITRSKSNRIWREEWLYRWGAGGTSRLSFANGRLTALETEATGIEPDAPVSVTLR